MKKITLLFSLLLLALTLAPALLADTLVLKSGKKIEGSVMKGGDTYQIETNDGKSQSIPAADVKEWIKSSSASSLSSSSSSNNPAKKSPTFSSTKSKAETAESPIAAIAVWQTFIDSTSPAPSASDLSAAKDEMKKWQKLADDEAEKINGKWVGGEERKAILTKAGGLIREGVTLLEADRTLLAIKKFEEAVKVYPNSYEATSLLGLLMLKSGKNEDGMKYFTACLKLRPNAADALNNVGVCLVMLTGNNRSPILWDKAFEKFRAAAEAEDDAMIAVNINRALQICPPEVRKTAIAKQAAEAATLLAAKYKLPADLTNASFMIMRPKAPKADDASFGPGVISGGTGFIINDDGLILTNRHVVQGAEHLLVILEGGKKVSATLVVIDKDLDLALIKIKSDKKLPAVAFAKADNPNEGAQCFAIGFPLLDRLGSGIKITQGIVSGASKAEGGADILTDAKVNPGNSGGPLADKFGQIMGIVTMKSVTTRTEDSYGMAISTGKIRKFLAANKATPLAAESDKTLTAEEVIAKIKPATVCILSVQ